MNQDLKKKGLYEAENIRNGLSNFGDRLSHEIIIIDYSSIKNNVEELEDNINKLSNRVLIVCENEKELNEIQSKESKENKENLKDLVESKRLILVKKDEIGKCENVEELYYKFRFLWIEKFFGLSNQTTLYLLNLGEQLKEKWKSQLGKSLPSVKIEIKFEFDSSSSTSRDNIVIDHHWMSYSILGIDNQLDRDFPDFYYENWGIQNYLTFVFNSPPNIWYEFLDRIIEFTEMGLLKIIIVDERIAEKVTSQRETIYGKSLHLWKMLRLQGAYIISHLKKNEYSIPISPNITERANTLEFKDDKICINGVEIESKFHAFIIHKTLLENEQLTPFLGVKNGINKWIEGIKKKIPFVILDSGRGEVDIPKGAKFLPYSFLEEVLITNTSKYKFTKTLLKLTRKKE